MKVFLFLFFVSFPHIVVGLTLLKVKLCFDFCAELVSAFPRLVKHCTGMYVYLKKYVGFIIPCKCCNVRFKTIAACSECAHEN